jgi:nucleoid DNA-binding protein
MIDGIAEALKTGDRVTLVGFGTFKVATRKARTGLNPQTKKKMNIPARKVPKFTPGKGLKDKI